MDQPSFHLFPRLQPELRRIIFLMAIETRIVDIRTKPLVELTEQEQEDGVSPFDTFASRVAPWNLTVDPRMAHFAHHWMSSIRLPQTPPRSSWNFRPRNPDSAIQTMLTAFGFTTTKLRRLPWTPTAECPELPPQLLYADPLAAWKMTRPHYLFSNAPIPPLLHTCFESREVLMRHGYQLAFGTRAAAPRTWFCFHRDVLYLHNLHYQWSSEPIYNRKWMYKEDSDIGVWDLDPQDLTRVRRLALDNGRFSAASPSDASRTLRACQNVVELFGVQHRPDHAMLNTMLEGLISSKRLSYELHEIDTLREQVCYDKDFQKPLSGVAFDFIVWEKTGKTVEWQASWEISHNQMLHQYFVQQVRVEWIGWELSYEKRDEMLGKGEEGRDGDVKTWKVPPVIREVMIVTRNAIDALCQTRGRLRRRHRQEGCLTPWDKLPSLHRWDYLDNGPSDDGYMTCWRH
jgi:hypothetical protein